MSTSNAKYLFYKKMFKTDTHMKLDESIIIKYTSELLAYRLLNPNLVKFEDLDDVSFELKTGDLGFVSGLGNNHDMGNYEKSFKLGMYFDHTTGLPAIKGEGIKAAVREPFIRLRKAGQENTKYKAFSKEAALEYFKNIFEEIGIEIPDKAMLKKLEDEMFEGKVENEISEGRAEESYLSPYLRDDFLDAYITRGASHNMIFEEDVITPHSDDITKNPIPIKFLKVRPNVTFAFRFDVQGSLALTNLNEKKKIELIKQIILREKLGAKTTFGYGKFVE